MTLLGLAPDTYGAAIVAGFNATSDARNDDGTYNSAGSAVQVPIGFGADFFGLSFNSLYINTNGNVSLSTPFSSYSSALGLAGLAQQIIAPFYADVDTRNTASGVTTFGTGTFDGRNAFGVNWIDVGYFSNRADKTNSFQLLLVERSDTGAGNFDIIFNYDRISWESGNSTGGTSGLGGSSARAGFSSGSGNPGTSFELPGSAVNGALLDGGANALISNRLNSDVDGRYIFFARNGTVSTDLPEPSTWLMMGAGLAGLLAVRRRR
jgi:hypothetical protein